MRVLDASVLAKCFLLEADSAVARAVVATGLPWSAPDLVLLEVANVALKSHRRGLIDRALAEGIVEGAPRLLQEIVPAQGLADAALRLALDTGASAHDGVYLALAQVRRTSLVTADIKLVARARDAGLGHLVQELHTA